MKNYEKTTFFELIKQHIDDHGYHVTIVNSNLEPRFAYSIGLNPSFGFELVLAGAIYYLKEDLFNIFKVVIEQLNKNDDLNGRRFEIGNLGTFLISNVDDTWSKLMLLGVYDYYKIDNLNVFQIIPESKPTLDIPEMAKKFVASNEPVWQWLVSKWNHPVPENSTVTTNIETLLGNPVTELTRWEADEWEMFAGAGPEVEKKDVRVVSLATMIGIDKSLLPALNLEIEGGLWRESREADWNAWE